MEAGVGQGYLPSAGMESTMLAATLPIRFVEALALIQ